MSVVSPDPYYTAGWTSQHQHRTIADPPYLDLREPPQDDQEAPDTAKKADRRPRKR